MVERSLALVLAAAALATGCDGGGDSEPSPTTPRTPTTPAPEPPEPKQRGVELRLDRDTARSGDTLELTVANHTGTRLEYGVAYRLDHFQEGKWRWINRDAAFVLILKVVEAGRREREEITLPERLEPGRYRIVKSFLAPATGRRMDASVGFRILEERSP